MPVAIAVEKVSKWFRLRRNHPMTLQGSVHQWFTGYSAKTDILWALREVSFSVELGQVFGIIGHNGAGKSTLLRLLCGLGLPSSGTISRVSAVSGILELGGGFHPDLTGRQNLQTVGLLNGLRKAQMREREQHIIAFAELEKFIDQPVKTYSSGMYLRLAFAAAMEFETAVLIIDEMLAVGDERFQKKCLARIAKFKSAGNTLVITSHSTEQIEALCDQVLVLEEGQVVLKSDPTSAISCYHDLMRQRTDRRIAQLGGSTDVPMMTNQGARHGTQEATICAFRIYNKHGMVTNRIQSGESLTIEIEIQITPPLTDLACTLGIFTQGEIKCFESAIPSLQVAFGSPAIHQRIRCEIQALALHDGQYFINVGLYPTDWAYRYDFHWQMYPLFVEGDHHRAGIYTSGVIAAETKWEQF